MRGRHGRKLSWDANQTLFMIPRWVIKRLWIFSCAFTLPSFEGHDLEGLDGHGIFVRLQYFFSFSNEVLYTPDNCVFSHT